MNSWKGKTALVTGASAGIGVEFAKQLAAHGCNLILTARRRERLVALADEIKKSHNVTITVLPGDLSDPAFPAELEKQVASANLHVDILVNNAGLGGVAPVLDQPVESLRQSMQVNMIALTELTRRFAPAMVQRGFGHVILLGSTGGFLPVPRFAVYTATKHYVRAFGEALAHELNGTGVHVTTVHPGGTESEFPDIAGLKLTRTAQSQMMPADAVVRIGLKSAMAGHVSVVTGFMNKLQVFLFWLLPRAITMTIADNLYRSMQGTKDGSPLTGNKP